MDELTTMEIKEFFAKDREGKPSIRMVYMVDGRFTHVMRCDKPLNEIKPNDFVMPVPTPHIANSFYFELE